MSFKTYVAPLKTTSAPLAALSLGRTGLTLIEGVSRLVRMDLTPPFPEPVPSFAISSSDPAVAIGEVIHQGTLRIIGLSPGTANITAQSGALSASIAIVVEAYPEIVKLVYPPVPAIPATSLALDVTAKTISVLQQFDVSALVQPYGFNRDSLRWASSDSSVAIVADVSYIEHQTGIYRGGHCATIRGIAPGTATITATVGALSASCVVIVA